MAPRVLIAGVGNIFLGDDGFGAEVARQLAAEPLPDGVEVADFGIRGVHLAYQLLDGYDGLILIDTVSRDSRPGTVYVIEPDLDEAVPSGEPAAPVMDAHGMEPAAVFSLLKTLGGHVERTVVVGCEPADVTERIGLSEPVAEAVDAAAEAVLDQLRGLLADADAAEPTDERG